MDYQHTSDQIPRVRRQVSRNGESPILDLLQQHADVLVIKRKTTGEEGV
jgi:hypothetical protein